MRILLWYLCIGVTSVTIYATITYVSCLMKFGELVVRAATKYVYEHNTCRGHTIVWTIANGIVGIFLWPIRLSEAPSMAEDLYDECLEMKRVLEEVNKDETNEEA